MINIEEVDTRQWKTIIAPIPPNSPSYRPQPQRRGRSGIFLEEISHGKIRQKKGCIISSLINASSLRNRSIKFEAINCPIIESLLSFNNLTINLSWKYQPGEGLQIQASLVLFEHQLQRGGISGHHKFGK